MNAVELIFLLDDFCFHDHTYIATFLNADLFHMCSAVSNLLDVICFVLIAFL